jgi:hypothetical protein
MKHDHDFCFKLDIFLLVSVDNLNGCIVEPMGVPTILNQKNLHFQCVLAGIQHSIITLPWQRTVFPNPKKCLKINFSQCSDNIKLKNGVPMFFGTRNRMVAFSKTSDQQGCQI